MSDHQKSQPALLEEIAKRLVEGDETALELLLRGVVPKTKAFLRKKFGSLLKEEVLEDALSTAVYQFWAHRNRFDPGKATVDKWFYVISRNAVIDEFRKQQRSKEFADENAVAEFCTFGRSIARFTHDLEQALSGLSDYERRVMEADLLHPPWGVPTKVLAFELGMSEAAIRGIRSRGRRKVRQRLTDLGYEIENL